MVVNLRGGGKRVDSIRYSCNGSTLTPVTRISENTSLDNADGANILVFHVNPRDTVTISSTKSTVYLKYIIEIY